MSIEKLIQKNYAKFLDQSKVRKMKIIFKAKNHMDAWSFFQAIKGYSFFDFIQRKNLTLPKEHITLVESYEGRKNVYCIHFKDKNQTGFFAYEGEIALKDLAEVKVKTQPTANAVVNYFSPTMPHLWFLAIVLVVNQFFKMNVVFPVALLAPIFLGLFFLLFVSPKVKNSIQALGTRKTSFMILMFGVILTSFSTYILMTKNPKPIVKLNSSNERSISSEK